MCEGCVSYSCEFEMFRIH
uniref:Uncharacterized protein n=1 Tax=Anguilla anguilla TaxID=7936 RepID=A0A0E9VDM1_ANGAN